MKRIITSFMVAVLCGGAMAQTLSIANVEALPGETVAFGLTINVQEGAYTGFQFQMQFPATGFSTNGSTISSAWDGASFGVGDLVDGVANASAYSSSDTNIPNGEQLIGTVRFTVNNNVAVGDYDVTISGFNFLDGTNYTPVADVTFTVHVVNVHSVLLDENSTTVPESAQGVNVRVMRTLNANEWSTICLPFAMTEEQVTTAFGNDVGLGDFQGYEHDADAGKITVLFNDVTAMEANHPYIIRVTQAMTEFTVYGVDVAPSDDPRVSFATGKKKKDFVGTFVANFDFYEDAKNTPLFLSGNRFWYASEDTQKMKAFRAYFDFDDEEPGEGADTRVDFAFNDGEATGISGVQGTEADGTYYNLNGQAVKSPAKGLYIRQGKKVIMK